MKPAYKQAIEDEDFLENVKAAWMDEFIDRGITFDQIKIALNKAAESDSPFFPSFGQFLKWCTPTPEDLRLPTFNDCYRQACRLSGDKKESPEGTHELVRYVMRKVGTWKLSTQAEYKTKQEAKEVYEEGVKTLCAGGQLISPQLSTMNKKAKRSQKDVNYDEGLTQVTKLLEKLYEVDGSN